MAKRRRKRLKPADPVQQVLGELLGEIQNTVANSLSQILIPPPQAPFFQAVHEPLHNEIKDAEVISIRKG